MRKISISAWDKMITQAPVSAIRSERILIVDDVAVMRKFISNALNAGGYHHISYAENGILALQRLAIENIDCVITDWKMPNLSGLGLVKKMRAEPAWAHIPVILISAQVDPQKVALARKAGVSAFILKPFESQNLLTKLNQIFPEPSTKLGS